MVVVAVVAVVVVVVVVVSIRLPAVADEAVSVGFGSEKWIRRRVLK